MNTTTIDQVARGMFSFQTDGKWARLDNLLRVGLDIPLPREAGNRRKSSIPATFTEGLKVLLKMFKVNESGMFADFEKFNAQGFRKTFYNEFQSKIWCCRSTISRMIRAFKKAGILDSYQEINEDGSMGAWWIRINPYALLNWLAGLTNKRPSKSPAPCVNDAQPLSLHKQQAPVADAPSGPSDSGEKGITSPGGEDSSFSDFARKEILKTDTGKVLEKLQKVIPEFKKVTTKQLQKLHDLVHHFTPALRCNEEMVTSLSETIAYSPAMLDRFSKLGNPDPDAALGAVDTFLKFWPGICRKLWANRLAIHDQNCYDGRYAMHQLNEELFAPANATTLNQTRKQDPGSYWIRCLALALTHKWSAPVLAVVAKKARGFIMHQPSVYAIIQKRFPQVGRVCNIPERCHKKLMNDALKVRTRIKVWLGIQEKYGFEFTPTPFQLLRERSDAARSCLPRVEIGRWADGNSTLDSAMVLTFNTTQDGSC